MVRKGWVSLRQRVLMRKRMDELNESHKFCVVSGTTVVVPTELVQWECILNLKLTVNTIMTQAIKTFTQVLYLRTNSRY